MVRPRRPAASPTVTSEAVVERMGRALRRLTLGTALSVAVVCKPVPAPRPRMTKTGHVYYPKPYVEQQGLLQREFAVQRPAGQPLVGALVVSAELVMPKPKSTVRCAPPGDVDNLAKGPLDAITKTGRYWADDTQVAQLFIEKRWAEPGEEPSVRLRINTLED
jgi:Holliday junction resolvase RusA-like endonuclease